MFGRFGFGGFGQQQEEEEPRGEDGSPPRKQNGRDGQRGSDTEDTGVDAGRALPPQEEPRRRDTERHVERGGDDARDTSLPGPPVAKERAGPDSSGWGVGEESPDGQAGNARRELRRQEGFRRRETDEGKDQRPKGDGEERYGDKSEKEDSGARGGDGRRRSDGHSSEREVNGESRRLQRQEGFNRRDGGNRRHSSDDEGGSAGKAAEHRAGAPRGRDCLLYTSDAADE